MDNKYSYSDYFNFIKSLNKLEKELMEKLKKDIPYVGISIQLFKEIQDDFSPTREHINAINCYCSNIQKTEKYKCNEFDVQAKNYYFNDILLKKPIYDEKTNPVSLLCFCHAEVTNLLFLYNPLELNEYTQFNNKDVNIFIFIGHILLNEYPYTKIYNDELELYDESDGEKYNLIKEFTPINQENEKYNKKYKSENCPQNITTVSLEKINKAKLRIQEKLTNFLISEDYIEKKDNILSIKNKLININNLPSINKITDLLNTIDKQIWKFQSINIQNKKRFIKIKRDISKKIKKTKALLYEIRLGSNITTGHKIQQSFTHNSLYNIYGWLQKGVNGEIGLDNWLKEYETNYFNK